MLITHFQGLGLDIVISDIPFSLSFQLKLLPQIPKFQWTSNPLILPSFYCSSFLPCPCILLPVLDSMEYHNLSLVLLSLQLGQNSNYRSTAIPFCSLPVPKLLKVAGKKTHNHSDYYHFKFMTTNFKRTSVWHCHLLQKWKVVVGQSCQTLCDPMDCSPPGSSVHGILQEYWSGEPFPSPGVFPNPGMEPSPPALQADFFTIWATIFLLWSLTLPLSKTTLFFLCFPL